MAATNQHTQAPVGAAGVGATGAAAGGGGPPMAARLTTEQIWHQLAKGSFAVLSHVTPAGEPRSSGVLYKTIGRRLYIVTAPDSWKARHIAASGRVAVTVPVRRGGLLALVLPIPPATISFHGTAIVHAADSAERQASACIIEILPAGFFVTYGVGVSLTQMRDPAAARARVPVTQEGNTR